MKSHSNLIEVIFRDILPTASLSSPPPFEVSDLPEDQLHRPDHALPLRERQSSVDPASFVLRKCSTVLSTGNNRNYKKIVIKMRYMYLSLL